MDTSTVDIKHFALFDGIDEDVIRAVKRIVKVQNYKKNAIIQLPVNAPKLLYFIKSGHVKITRLTADGKEMIVDIVGPGELIGELAYIDDFEDVTEVVQALDEVIICSVQRFEFDKLLNQKPQLSVYLTRRLGWRLRKIEERMRDMLFKDVKKRIASFLVRHSEEFGRMKHQSVFIEPYLSHHDIALLTGSTRQTVTSTLNEFRTLGIIDFSRQGFTINDYERLKQLAV